MGIMDLFKKKSSGNEALDVKITETESDSNNGMVPALVANIPIRDMKHRPDPR